MATPGSNGISSPFPSGNLIGQSPSYTLVGQSPSAVPNRRVSSVFNPVTAPGASVSDPLAEFKRQIQMSLDRCDETERSAEVAFRAIESAFDENGLISNAVVDGTYPIYNPPY